MVSKYIEYAKAFTDKEYVHDWVSITLAKKEDTVSTVEVEHIIDWLASPDAPTRIKNMSVSVALEKSKQWVEKMNEEAYEIKELPEDTETVLDFGDGFRFVKLIGENSFKREGLLMGHCVASYYGKDTTVYSLRDKKNNPHCTVEKDNQVKGKGNGDIHPKYVHYVVTFFESLGMEMRDSEMKHLGYKNVVWCADKIENKNLFRDKYMRENDVIIPKEGYIYSEDKKDVLNMEKNVLFDGSLDLRETQITVLPEGLRVGGSLYLEETQITALPEGLRVGGSLDLRGTQITALPKGLRVGGSLDPRPPRNANHRTPRGTAGGWASLPRRNANHRTPRETAGGWASLPPRNANY